MELKQAFGSALRALRISRGLTQEDFALVSSRTFMSSLERGIKGATLEKIDDLAGTIGVHPVSVIVACYLKKDTDIKLEDILEQVRNDLR
ncbi:MULTISPECIES: helix-turn-helix domain-containing protein [unclassified Pseudomonas]|uniref:helix-turn-helix domain-containing protein n=1 Tax=unclassified Pseudomonas TaxID=196821 RepID=UPI000C883253|nr:MULTISPECIES: helix-turn-helix transcriptional regulator [unclassified Pseudomonas]PMZ91453.1 transcriptional regulator [Pseudomonas sp. FW215-T2]PNA14667.1 transcriptional regulator [Pseudomonas sp. FW215-R3]PNB38645.1 transcriptional regulator [Pseudomonas sp. FW305-131]